MRTTAMRMKAMYIECDGKLLEICRKCRVSDHYYEVLELVGCYRDGAG